ncbi:hypothetical protein STRDD10_00411 [Streptococcus sp. DD10]|uniref:VirD4-like conjugal transfer protein, CD1115 family n=1 Tax=Streptococcus sp. DD10 TaxID=1777878 RepID=UPI000794F5B2|nr:type IV secretory system conjugative DNA transfer family protein [Streptococcus sp. DD10]KXT75175.1 hypothetical protein STRDD10_00411 [Streptococcus sp. DD10]
MIVEKKQKRFLPYLGLGIILFYFFHWLAKLYGLAPQTDTLTDPFGLGKIEWMLDNFTQYPWIDLQFTSASLFAGIFGFFLALFLYMRITDTGVYRYGEEHGSARFATAQELSSFRDSEANNNKIFTQNAQMGLLNKRLPYKRQLNKNTVVIGGPGSGKTFTFVKPNALQTVASKIFTDTKGLLIHETGQSFINQGYKLKVFDLISLTNSDSFNVFRYMKKETDIDRVAEAIVTATKKSDQQGEDFWQQAQMLLMRALIGYIYFDSQLSGYEASLPQVVDLIRNLKRDHPDVESPVEMMFEQLEIDLPSNYACKQWKLFNKNFDGQTRTSVFAIVASTFSVFDHEDVRKLVEKDTMQIENWNIEKTVVFINIPENNTAYQFLSALLFSTIFEVTISTADQIIKGIHPYAKELLHLQVEGDEFANVGKIPNFAQVLSTVRSREISVDIIIQALPQLEDLYGKAQARAIINNCDSLLYLGGADEDTLKYLSFRAGSQTINDQNFSESRGRNGSNSKQHSKIKRELMDPHEVATIDIDEALLFISKQNVFRDQKANVNQHPRVAELANSPYDATWYRYKRYMSDIDEWKEQVGEENVIYATLSDLDEVPLVT